jgi:hypothetical protein
MRVTRSFTRLKEVNVIQLKDLYSRMTRISERYLQLKTIFDNFCHLAAAQLTDDRYTVKGITFSANLERNSFDVSFAGKTVRFSFFVAEDEKPSLQGIVECNPIGRDQKPMATVIGKFSFNHRAETSFKSADDDPLGIDVQWAAGYLVLHFLCDALDKMTEPANPADRNPTGRSG